MTWVLTWLAIGTVITALTRKQIREAAIAEFGYEDRAVLALSFLAGIIFWPLCLSALRR
jgi:hypothetical protein